MIERSQFARSMFSGARQIDTFNAMHRIFPVSTMRASPRPFTFPEGASLQLPSTYRPREP